eukprot:Hpha_TRINITY_DN25949_c0_g1::TRINITY_DN25949_c0_g1_i1::g.185357::m.185357
MPHADPSDVASALVRQCDDLHETVLQLLQSPSVGSLSVEQLRGIAKRVTRIAGNLDTAAGLAAQACGREAEAAVLMDEAAAAQQAAFHHRGDADHRQRQSREMEQMVGNVKAHLAQFPNDSEERWFVRDHVLPRMQGKQLRIKEAADTSQRMAEEMAERVERLMPEVQKCVIPGLVHSAEAMEEAYQEAKDREPGHLERVSDLFEEICGGPRRFWHKQHSSNTPEEKPLRQPHVEVTAAGPALSPALRQLQLEAKGLLLGSTGSGPLLQLAHQLQEDCKTDVTLSVPSIKGTARAMQKVLEDYSGDVGRLLDVARLALVCDNFAAICRLLESIKIAVSETRLVILRGKDRLQPDFPAATETSGYRDLVLNVGLPGHDHLCELQIQLRSLFELKSESHQHYGPARTLHLTDSYIIEYQGDWSADVQLKLESGAIRILRLECSPNLDVGVLCSALRASTCVVRKLYLAFIDLGPCVQTLQSLLEDPDALSFLRTLDLSNTRGTKAELVRSAICRRKMLEVMARDLALNCPFAKVLGSQGGEKLVRLDLMNAGLYGPVPEELCRLSSLEYLYLANNSIQKHADRLGTLRSLRLLTINHNRRMFDKIPESFRGLTALKSLRLHGIDFRGSVDALSEMGRLTKARLQGNKIDTIPSSLVRATSLTSLELHDNCLNCPLPAWLAQLTGLEVLTLDGREGKAAPTAKGQSPQDARSPAKGRSPKDGKSDARGSPAKGPLPDADTKSE